MPVTVTKTTVVLEELFGTPTPAAAAAAAAAAGVLNGLFGSMVKGATVQQTDILGGLFGNMVPDITTVTQTVTASTAFATTDMLSLLGNPELEYVYRVIQVIFPQQTDTEKRQLAVLIHALRQALKDSNPESKVLPLNLSVELIINHLFE
jgi:hypothetical protein